MDDGFCLSQSMPEIVQEQESKQEGCAQDEQDTSISSSRLTGISYDS
jgi:hypothetical protein